MIKIEFGIIEHLDENKDYSNYEPSRYHCIFIYDDWYIDDWWDRLILMKTYFNNLKCPNYGLARWGVTLILPQSLPAFQEIVISDKRINKDEHLVDLANTIARAIEEQKYMIHYGV